MRRLLFFYKPSSKLYASLELDHSKARQLTVVGCQFIEFLLESDEVRRKDILKIWAYLLPFIYSVMWLQTYVTFFHTVSQSVFHRRKNYTIDDNFELFFCLLRMARCILRTWWRTLFSGCPHPLGWNQTVVCRATASSPVSASTTSSSSALSLPTCRVLRCLRSAASSNG